MAINPLQPAINYMGMLPQIDLGRSFEELGATLEHRQDMLRKQEEARRAEDARIQYSKDLQATLDNPTPQAFAALSAKYPQQREAFKQSWEMLNKDQQDSEFLAGSQAFNAIRSGNVQVAKDLIDQRIVAMENSGQPTQKMQVIRQALEGDPKAVQSQLGLVLSAIDPDRWTKFATGSTALEKAGAELTESQAKAQSAAVAAKFAESNAALDLKKKGWDITKIQEDIKIAKQNAGIAALNARIAREGNDLKRRELQLKVKEMEQKRDEAVRGKVAEASTAAAQADNLLNTVEKALNMSVTGRDKAGKPTGFTGTITSATGPISSRMPTLSQDVADFEETINTLGSQIVMSRIGEMKGALSDKDLATLQSSLQSLSLRQSPQQLVNNLLEVQRLTQKARKNTMDKFGAPATLSVPDTPGADPGAPAPAPGAPVSVTAPNGQVLTFPSQQAADAFKKAAGIR